MMYKFILEDFKDPDFPSRTDGGSVIVGVERVSVTEQITSMHEN